MSKGSEVVQRHALAARPVHAEGGGVEALQLFEEMLLQGLQPSVTVYAALSGMQEPVGCGGLCSSCELWLQGLQPVGSHSSVLVHAEEPEGSEGFAAFRVDAAAGLHLVSRRQSR